METETSDSTVTTTVQPLAGGGVVETIERHEEHPAPEPIVIEPAADLDPVLSRLDSLAEQITALSGRVDDLSAARPPAALVEAPMAPEPPPSESEDVLELEDAEELPEPTAKETTIKPAKEVSDEKPSKKKHAGFFI